MSHMRNTIYNTALVRVPFYYSTSKILEVRRLITQRN
jgi:hypothetical protein